MPAISTLFRRLGFVKLDDYGLILTPDNRVMSTRSHVLDDGLGGKIVGWQEGDLAAMELERWTPGHAPAKPVAPPKLPPRPAIAAPSASPKGERDNVSPFARTAPAPALATPTPAKPAAPVVPQPPRRRLPGVATMPTAFPVVAIAQVPAPAPVAAPVVAPPAQPEEDEWEWEIAMARARAAAEWAEEAAEEVVTARRPPVLPAPDTDSWPKTEPLNEVWDPPSSPISTERILRLAHTPVVKLPAKPTPTSMPIATPKTSRTVIPVPELPRAADPRSVRPVSGTRPPPMRIPRATQNSRFEETIRTHAATPVNDDATSPHIALPPAPSSSGKRVAAKQR